MEYLTGQQEKEATHWINEAAKIAKKSLCLRAKCGIVIVSNGEIIGEGYSAPPFDDPKNKMCLNEYQLPEKFKYDRTCCMHAEWRAIIDALTNDPEKIKGSTLYFTRIKENTDHWRKPFCTVCSRMILDVGIKEVVLRQEKGLCLYKADEYNKVSYEYVPVDKN